MELNLKGKTAAITGASKGIGFGIAEELAREGVNLQLAARNGDALTRAADDLRRRFGVQVGTHAVDLAQRDPRDAFAREIAGVDILVNCAGAIPGGTLDQVDEDRWREGWELKLFGYFGITPGPVDTPRLQTLQKQAEEKVAPQDLEGWRRQRFRGMAYGRPAHVNEISGMVAFLASDRASYITGTMINIEGGTIARGGAPGDLIGS